MLELGPLSVTTAIFPRMPKSRSSTGMVIERLPVPHCVRRLTQPSHRCTFFQPMFIKMNAARIWEASVSERQMCRVGWPIDDEPEAAALR